MSRIRTFATALVTAGAMFCATNAAAATITLSDTYDSEGQTFVFDFDGLGQQNSATLTLASGDPAQATGQEFPGFDLDGSTEFFDLSFDGEQIGRFNCGGGNGITVIADQDTSGPFGGTDCAFTISFDVAAELLSDGQLIVTVAFSNDVGDFRERDTLFATLVTADAVPLPGAVAFFLPALAGLGYARRRAAA